MSLINMFFHIDEAGNTGNNLFDTAQPRLSYGVLSSLKNVDVLCLTLHKKIHNKIGKNQIHANELGFGRLIEIAPTLIEIHKKMKFNFDYYFIEKPDFALVLFFDAVFDEGLNDAVRWDTYWTPLRYLIIQKLAVLFDTNLLRKSWQLCTEKKIAKFESDIIELLTEVKLRAENSILDDRSKELIIDALNFGLANPMKLDFGTPDEKLISPNAVAFQFAVSCIARRTRKKKLKNFCSVIVDRQHQFNASQIRTHYNSARIAEGIKNAPENQRKYIINHPLNATLTEDQIRNKGLTDKELTISKSIDSIGLQIVDVYLWLANKVISGQKLPTELESLWSLVSKKSIIDGISMAGMGYRFSEFEKMLPKLEDISAEQKKMVQESVEKHRNKVHSLNL